MKTLRQIVEEVLNEQNDVHTIVNHLVKSWNPRTYRTNKKSIKLNPDGSVEYLVRPITKDLVRNKSFVDTHRDKSYIDNIEKYGVVRHTPSHRIVDSFLNRLNNEGHETTYNHSPSDFDNMTQNTKHFAIHISKTPDGHNMKFTPKNLQG